MFLQSQSYQKITDLSSELSYNARKYLNHTFAILLLLTPVLIAYSFYSTNKSLKNELETKKNVLSLIHQIRGTRSQNSTYRQGLASSLNVTTRQDLEVQLRQRLSTLQINNNQVQIANFEVDEVSPQSHLTRSQLRLNSLNINQFANLLSLLRNEYRMFIEEMEVTTMKNEELLSGEIDLVFLRRVEVAGR